MQLKHYIMLYYKNFILILFLTFTTNVFGELRDYTNDVIVVSGKATQVISIYYKSERPSDLVVFTIPNIDYINLEVNIDNNKVDYKSKPVGNTKVITLPSVHSGYSEHHLSLSMNYKVSSGEDAIIGGLYSINGETVSSGSFSAKIVTRYDIKSISGLNLSKNEKENGITTLLGNAQNNLKIVIGLNSSYWLLGKVLKISLWLFIFFTLLPIITYALLKYHTHRGIKVIGEQKLPPSGIAPIDIYYLTTKRSPLNGVMSWRHGIAITLLSLGLAKRIGMKDSDKSMGITRSDKEPTLHSEFVLYRTLFNDSADFVIREGKGMIEAEAKNATKRITTLATSNSKLQQRILNNVKKVVEFNYGGAKYFSKNILEQITGIFVACSSFLFILAIEYFAEYYSFLGAFILFLGATLSIFLFFRIGIRQENITLGLIVSLIVAFILLITSIVLNIIATGFDAKSIFGYISYLLFTLFTIGGYWFLPSLTDEGVKLYEGIGRYKNYITGESGKKDLFNQGSNSNKQNAEYGVNVEMFEEHLRYALGFRLEDMWTTLFEDGLVNNGTKFIYSYNWYSGGKDLSSRSVSMLLGGVLNRIKDKIL